MLESPSKKEREIIESKNTDTDSAVIEETAEVVREVVIEAIREEFSGPIPPPSIIKGYEDVLEGSADRIISMAEKQADHRQRMEQKMIAAESRDSLLGVLFAFLLGIGCILAAVFMVYLVPKNGGAIAAALLGVTGVGSITSSFIRSTRGNNPKKETGQNK